jgi:NADH:ubiquinone oxidoreductase subunit F (NADH-binding)
MTSADDRPPPSTTSPTPRLLEGFLSTGQPASLREHLDRYGPLPSATVRPGGEPSLVELVEASGLLGHGGAGFPTGRKMRTVAASGRSTVVVANGMEGEPAAGKDALLLRVAPHLVFDGIELAATAVGADRAHLVVHRGSASASQLRATQAERRPWPGLTVTVEEVPPHYVSSEETALVHWLNGGEAKPLFVPPRPFEKGVAGRPTLINNVETLAHLALIARKGSTWFRSVGDPHEPGTMLLTVSGESAAPRVLEVPTGTLVGEVLALAGVELHALQALVVGGYFGTWIPVDVAATLPLTHAGLKAVGGALGAGIILALPRSACGLVETAHVLSYLADQSARQCGPCVRGLPAIAGALHELAHGPWPVERRADLDRWLSIIAGRGACRHPDGAVRFAASALQVFGHEVERHENQGPCAAASHAPSFPVGGPRPTGWR